MGLVNAERLFVHEVARRHVRARSASHADVAKFAAAALPFRLLVSRNSWKTCEFSQMSLKVCFRRPPAMTGKYPQGQTSPSCEMKQTPVPASILSSSRSGPMDVRPDVPQAARDRGA
jgi:hypothetical protein